MSIGIENAIDRRALSHQPSEPLLLWLFLFWLLPGAAAAGRGGEEATGVRGVPLALVLVPPPRVRRRARARLPPGSRRACCSASACVAAGQSARPSASATWMWARRRQQGEQCPKGHVGVGIEAL